jgi:hypothetical protein
LVVSRYSDFAIHRQHSAFTFHPFDVLALFQKDKHRPLATQENAMKTEMRILLFLVVLLLLTTLLSCTAGPNVLKGSSGANNVVAGSWRGLWHGFICLFTMIASLFSNSVTIYEVHNNGGWYNFGFVIGAAMFFWM